MRRQHMKKTLSFLILMALCAGSAFGEEYPYIYKGMRPMGMGGAFVAVSDDANALFYNPAGLARADRARLSVLPLEVEVGDNTLDMYEDSTDVDFDDPSETAEFLRSHVGDRAHLGVNMFPYFSMPRFAFGIFGTARADFEAQDMAYPKLYTNVVSDAGAGIGYARPFLDDSLSLGASLKFDHRESLSKVYTVMDITTDDFGDTIEDDLEKGSGVLLDLGAIYSLKKFGFDDVRVGACANNLIGGSLGDASDLDPHVDLGVAVEKNLWITKATFALDYVDVFSQLSGDNDLAKRIRMGVECRFPVLLTLRVGLYQGYFTGGVNMDAKFFQLDALTYSEEIGAYAGQRADRRYSVRILLGF
jgi:hypothetical protein